MEPRIGRNEPCWCGSGKKFKKCHSNRASAPRPSIQEVIETANAAYAQKVCLHPDLSTCNRGVINAHSVQQNGGLSRIAVNGKVYGIRENNIGDLSKCGGLMAPKLVGIGRASTFTGMCGFHDDQTFAPIEKQPFKACVEHAFLLGYRHFCKELFTKLAAANLFQFLRKGDRGLPFELQFAFQRFADMFQKGADQGRKDVEKIKAEYDAALLARDFSEVRYYVIRFNEVPDVLCCSGNFPLFDFQGNQLQTLMDLNKTPDDVTFSIIATRTGGAAVFSWLGNRPCSEQLVSSLHRINDLEIGDAIVRHAFEYCENCYLSPTWWDALDDGIKQAIRQRITDASDVNVRRNPKCLANDGHRYVKWTVSSRETNLSL